MKTLALTHRNLREILRDPLSFAFSLGFPLVLLALLYAIQSNIPVSLFELPSLTPGITVFGLSFLTLFSATLIARDRESALLQRLYTTPLTAVNFIFAYTLPILPLAVAQCAVCYLFAFVLGLPLSGSIAAAIAGVVPVSLLYLSLGLLFGSILNVKQVGGICGALLTNLAAWLSGTWFDLDLVGGAFRRIAYALPFVHAVEAERALLHADLVCALGHLLVVLAYALPLFAMAVLLFLRQMRQQS